MTIDSRVVRRALPLVMVLVGGCVGEPISAARVVVDRGDDDPLRFTALTVERFGAPIGPIDHPDPPECDFDDDGHEALSCGGDDCNDHSADVGPDVHEAEDWHVDVVAEGASLPSLAMDSRGIAHIAYRVTQPETAIVYATNESGSFLAETVDSLGETSNRPAIAVGPNGRAHICWSSYDRGSTLVGYATNSEGEWTTEVDEWHGGQPTRCTIAVDARGSVHMAYRDPVLGVLRYTTNSRGRWEVQVVDPQHGSGAFPVLMLDSAYVPHIGYQDSWNDLRYAVRSPNDGWQTQLVDEGFALGDVYSASFTLDAQTAVHVSYRAPTEHQLAYATNAPGFWVYDDLEVPGYAGVGSAIAVDMTGFPHIVYSRDDRRGQPEALLFTTRAGGAWSHQILDEEGGHTGWGPSLVVGSTLLHATYFRFVQGGSEDVLYATRQIPDAVDSDCDGEW